MSNDQDVEPQMPELLRYISLGLSIALVALAGATAWVWLPDSILGKVVGLLLFVAAAPPLTTIAVLEVANRISGGELRRSGNLKRARPK